MKAAGAAAVEVAAAVVVAAVLVAATDAVPVAPMLCAQAATRWLSMRRPTDSRSQQTWTRFHPGTSPPKWIDRDRGPSIVSMLMIGLSVINQNAYLQPSPYATIGPCLLAKL